MTAANVSLNMSETDDSTGSALPEPLRTVTPPSRTHPDESMDAIGWAMFLGLVVVLTPLIPIIAVIWLIAKVQDALRQA